MKIQVEIREVYGCPNIYPVCDKAKLFASIAKKKTLGVEILDSICELGFEVEFTSCPSVFSYIPKQFEVQK